MILKDLFIKDDNWTLDGIKGLGNKNLLVGMNAVGKSRTISAINHVALLIRQNEFPILGHIVATMGFIDDTHKVDYHFEIENGEVQNEELKVDGKNIIERNNEHCRIYDAIIAPPSNKLVVNARRDSNDYPYNDKLVEWAENTITIKFSSIENQPSDSKDMEKNPLVRMFEELNDEEHNKIIKQLQSLGYNITNIKVKNIASFHLFIIQERGVKNQLALGTLSTGLRRALYILIFVALYSRPDKKALIMIDDFCEGLDYERATKLGNLVYENFEEEGIQLITSSNDSFLMDVVDLRHWNILKRNGDNVRCYNYPSNTKMFKDFMLTGLSNFDFFASDFINKYEKNKHE